MPHLDAKPTYQVVLTDREFRLVTMALAGMHLDEEEEAEALRLNTHLCHQRVTQTRGQVEVFQKALEGAIALQKQHEETEEEKGQET